MVCKKGECLFINKKTGLRSNLQECVNCKILRIKYHSKEVLEWLS